MHSSEPKLAFKACQRPKKIQWYLKGCDTKNNSQKEHMWKYVNNPMNQSEDWKKLMLTCIEQLLLHLYKQHSKENILLSEGNKCPYKQL